MMAAALALGVRGRGRTAPNPAVGCIIAQGERIVGRGWTQPGGRPHAEAMALEQAGAESRGATVYTTLEPCAHVSPRGPACADLLVAAGAARVVVALGDPDVRTNGLGLQKVRAAGIVVTSGVLADEARRAMAGFLTRQAQGRPYVTLKLALSLDGAVAMADGTSKWITGPEARAHAHLERSRHEAILVGRGTVNADAPTLDVRLPGLEDRSPRRVMLSSTLPPSCGGDDARRAWTVIDAPADIATLEGVDHLMVEGGIQTAAAFLGADLVDRLLLYRAPILIGGGRTLPDIGLADLPEAHARWTRTDTRQLGSDRLDVYERAHSLSGS
jgi:diaminohydroxyphosphoribosylaminopyrimidine deaminase/5-amino-6-(5-phosphoribosylamino)uracil reductase